MTEQRFEQAKYAAQNIHLLETLLSEIRALKEENRSLKTDIQYRKDLIESYQESFSHYGKVLDNLVVFVAETAGADQTLTTVDEVSEHARLTLDYVRTELGAIVP